MISKAISIGKNLMVGILIGIKKHFFEKGKNSIDFRYYFSNFDKENV